LQCVAIGQSSKTTGNYGVAIGVNSGAADSCISIGTNAFLGVANSIVLNASTSGTAATQSGFYVQPIRNEVNASTVNIVPNPFPTTNAYAATYNTTTKEVTSRLFTSTYGISPFYQTINNTGGAATYDFQTPIPCGCYLARVTNGYQSDVAFAFVIYLPADVGVGANPYITNFVSRTCTLSARRNGGNQNFYLQVNALAGNVYYMQLTPV
jgi:hypothetical protein